MIKNKKEKITKICDTIQSRISDINLRYRSGPDLYFYKRVIKLRLNSQNIEVFLDSDYNIEILYATLVAWDMNSRGAKLKYFNDFKENLLSCKTDFLNLEEMMKAPQIDYLDIRNLLIIIYRELKLMKTNSKLVSNSKLLHFLFPTICMPMDRENTLNYLYGNTSESENKYLEITSLSFEILKNNQNFRKYLDDEWNVSIPKLIDNAIILNQDKSLK
jgi:hypothetical protein